MWPSADLLVTGTDTGVGKTVVTAAIVMALRRQGVPAVGFKPVESGLDGPGPADSDVLAEASALSPHDGAPALCRPLLRLAEPLAPAVAAERAGQSLDPAAVLDRVDRLRRLGYRVILEGAGGLLVPLTWDFTAADLASRAGLHAVIVARAGLGTLNAVVLTVEALARRNVPLAAVVLSGRSPQPDLAEATNPEALARLVPGVAIRVLDQQPAGPAVALARVFSRQLV